MTDGVVTSTQVPNLTVIAHDDKATAILDDIVKAFQIFEIFEPLIVNIIHPAGSSQIQLPATVQKWSDSVQKSDS